MTELSDYLWDSVTPGRSSASRKEDFWNRYGADSLKSEKFQKELERVGNDPKARHTLENMVKDATNANYMQYGEGYFQQWGANLARYGSAGLSGYGAVTASAAILALLAGGPLTAVAGIATGMTAIGLGALINSGADVYDSRKAQEAIDGTLKTGQKPSGYLGYIRKFAEKGWDLVSTPFRPETYKSLYNNMKQIAEGVGWRAIAYLGPGYMPELLVPYGQIAAFAGAAADFYRGRKKFDDKVINYITNKSLDEAIDKFRQQYNLEEVIEQKSMPQEKVLPGKIPIGYDSSHALYPLVGYQEPIRVLDRIKPRYVNANNR